MGAHDSKSMPTAVSQTKKTLHAILGVANDADAAAITQAYRDHKQRFADQPHTVESENQLKFVEHAYETLSDPVRRQLYENRLKADAAATAIMMEATDEPAPSRRGVGIVVMAVVAGLALWGGAKLLRNSHAAPLPKLAAVGNSARVFTPTAAPAAQELTPRDIFDRVNNSIVVVVGQQSTALNQEGAMSLGSGVVIAPGQIVTNCHVSADYYILHVRYHGQVYDARHRYIDRGHDLCQIEAPGLEAPAVIIGSVESVGVGDRVVALGAPQGLELTLSEGVISSLRDEAGSKLLQTSAAISPGSSGGGLFDRYGRLIGITTFQLITGQNLNFAVPADWIGQLESRNGNQDRLLPQNDAPPPSNNTAQ